jgi:putative flippase GtrA
MPVGQVVRYVLVSLSVYLYVLVAMWICVSLAGLEPTPAYVIVYITVYLLDYVLTLRIVFRTGHRWGRVLRYVVFLASSLVLGVVAFATINGFINAYLWATILTAGLLFPLRFYCSRRWVYS